MNIPKLSIVVPVYNAEKYIEKTLDSILAQTFSDFEIILVNDFSDDSTKEILSRYAKSDKRIIVLNNSKNFGAGASRNKGVLYAAGKYIGFVDNDDWVDSDYFEKMIESIEKNDAEVCVALKIKNHTEKKEKTHLIEKKDLKEAVFVLRTAPWAKIFKKEFLKNNHIKFDLTRGEDIYPAFLSAFLGCNIAFMDNSIYHCRIRKGSISHKGTTLFDLDEIRIYEKIFHYLSRSIYKDYWLKLIHKRGMISFDFLYSNAQTREMKTKVINEYKRVFGRFSKLEYFIWKILYKKEKFLSMMRGSKN